VTKEFKSLDAVLPKASGNATFTTNTLQMAISDTTATESAYLTYTAAPTVKVYSALSWSDVGGWTKTPTGGTEKLVTALSANDLIIPTKNVLSGAYSIGLKSGTTYPEENDDGIYFEVSSITVVSAESGYRWNKYTVQILYWGDDWYYGAGDFIGYVTSTNINAYPDGG
jgi:hypothetical protein